MNYPVPLYGVLMLKHNENLKTSLLRTLGLCLHKEVANYDIIS